MGIKENENYIIATYNVTSTQYNTGLFHHEFDINQVKSMTIDGVEVEPTHSYTFNTTDQHIVRIDLNGNFTNAAFMFSGCLSLTSLDLSSFDTSKVTTMGCMFEGCKSLTSLDLSNFDTSSVTNMSKMFYGCNSLTSLDLSNFDTSSVTNMSNMFECCISLTTLDLSSFDTSSVTDMSNMFYMESISGVRPSLISLKMMGDISNVLYVDDMFYYINTTGTFYYNSAYDYSKIIAALPSTWTAVNV